MHAHTDKRTGNFELALHFFLFSMAQLPKKKLTKYTLFIIQNVEAKLVVINQCKNKMDVVRMYTRVKSRNKKTRAAAVYSMALRLKLLHLNPCRTQAKIKSNFSSATRLFNAIHLLCVLYNLNGFREGAIY